MNTVSAQIKGHSQLDRHFEKILIKRHFFAPKVHFLGQKLGKFKYTATEKPSKIYRTLSFYLRGYGSSTIFFAKIAKLA